MAGGTRKVCRRHNITGTTFYRWKQNCGRGEVSEAKRLRELEYQTSRLKRMLADLSLHRQMIEEVHGKEWQACTRGVGRPSTWSRRSAVATAWLRGGLRVPQRRNG